MTEDGVATAPHDDVSPEDVVPAHGLSPLSATSYPWWVVGFGLLVLAAFGYSLFSVPRHVALARQLAAAERLDSEAKYPAAEKLYASLLADMPESKAARLGMAHALFADTTPENDLTGLALLANLTIDDQEWKKLTPVMPEAFQRQFTQEKR